MAAYVGGEPALAPLSPDSAPLVRPELSSFRALLPTGIDLHYVVKRPSVVRPGVAPLLLVHGYSDSWRSFEELLDALSADDLGAPVYAVDLRGHGRSSVPSEPAFGLSDFAADLAALLNTLEIERAVVVGHSLGGLIAQRFAVEHPERVAQLVLIATTATMAGSQALAEMRGDVAAFDDEAPAPAAFVEAFQASCFSAPPAPRVLHRYVSESLRLTGRVWKAVLDTLDREDHRDRLREVAAPTLILWGERDPFVSREEQEALCALLSDAQLVMFPDASHALNVERAAEVAEALRRDF